MNIYSPADDRATTCFRILMQNFHTNINNSNTTNDIVNAIVTGLPFALAYLTELRLKFSLNNSKNIEEQKILTIDIAEYEVLSSICEGLPFVHDSNGSKLYYYMREDIVNWYNSSPGNINFFPNPQVEIITIQINHPTNPKTSNLKLNKDQIIGICYALDGINNNYITIRSSITNDVVNVSDIAQHALAYRLPIELATERLKRPFSVDILQSNNIFITLYFINPEFMQGIMSTAQWYNLENNGKNLLWKNLTQFTREGLISLVF